MRLSHFIVSGTRAAGVEYIQDGKTYTVKASKQIVISGGAFGTPAIVRIQDETKCLIFCSTFLFLTARTLRTRRQGRAIEGRSRCRGRSSRRGRTLDRYVLRVDLFYSLADRLLDST